ncbi:DUF692 domain-containing protein [Streptomyces sp. J2-1]|uniref:DUF692 domain-containing protein n=1 Tax=Streptomyces corallincola TaxID=2851888 RepID=UPI001C38D9A6|nr:DUF692 domain-containing protein [Streptomyces corallincola]MBV2354691.1 DUF692 domain-containing protein [Streptomyces corallincola]
MAARDAIDLGFAPTYGAGLGYRKELIEEFAQRRQELDVVEILADQWLGDPGYHGLRGVAHEFPTVVHGVGMSVAGAGRISGDYLAELRRITEICAAPFYSEHLAMTHVPGMDSGHLCPPVISEESLRTCIRNVDQAQDALGVPLALENITYSFSLGGDHLAAASFFTELVTATGCLILLDVCNLYINSRNHSFDPLGYLDALPVDRVVQVHLAGGVVASTGQYIDSHSESIGDGIWQLAAETAKRCRPSAVIVERDQNFPDMDALVKEVATSRDIYFPEGC